MFTAIDSHPEDLDLASTKVYMSHW